MKKLILVLMILTLGLALDGCSNIEELTVKEKQESTLFTGNDQLKRKIIIRDSVYDPLPSEAINILSLPDNNELQQLPNVDLNTPIIITKMPYHKNIE
ncbi:hypothetical protein [Desulfosporosinus youngiae]|uniref:Uncharacterized protein n=1 Tax=Desulfosporosinus youngiae DSM 17734 TaxID=768710 RepID=H5Y640_9FIRM|nr:hypothetical protein [Desulfosporosinus youngiae]EHQ91050.1 hypothetical protein DesyoDRAFT_4084 [Desulfosporosinus youngiae DSM 17734]